MSMAFCGAAMMSAVAVAVVVLGTVHGARPRAAAAYVIAAAVHLGVAGLVVGALVLIVRGWSSVLQPVAGVILFALAVHLWPRPATLAPGPLVLEREQAPEMFRLLDRTADAAGARHVDLVHLTAEFAVRVETTGPRRRRRVLLLGHPLWLVNGPRQRATAVADALVCQAHDLRGAPLIDSALGILRRASSLAGRPPASDHAVDVLLRPSALSRYGDELSAAAGRFTVRTCMVDWTLFGPALTPARAEVMESELREPARALAEAIIRGDHPATTPSEDTPWVSVSRSGASLRAS